MGANIVGARQDLTSLVGRGVEKKRALVHSQKSSFLKEASNEGWMRLARAI